MRWADATEPFEKWAHRRAASVASDAVLPAIRDSFSKEVEGIGTGVRGLVFGLLVIVDHDAPVQLGGDEKQPDPSVSYDVLVDRSPRTVTVVLQDRSHSRNVAVAVGDEADAEPDP